MSHAIPILLTLTLAATAPPASFLAVFAAASCGFIAVMLLWVSLLRRKAQQRAGELAALMRTIPDLIITFSRDGVYLAIRASDPRLLIAPADQVIHRHVREVLPPEVAEQCCQGIERALACGEVQDLTYSLQIGGEEKSFEARLAPSEDGRVIAIVRDVTARKRVEDELKQSKANLSAIMDSTNDMIWSVDRNHRLLAFNATLAEHIRQAYGRTAAIGAPPEEVLPPERIANWAPLYERCFKEGPFSQEYALEGDRLVDLTFHPITQGSEVLGVSVFGRDITERKHAEDTLRESNQRLELAMTSGRLGIWELNLVDGSQVWNDRMYEIYGLEPQSRHPDHAYWCAHIVHPDDLETANAAIHAAFAGTQPYDLAFRVVRPDGKVRHIKSDALVLRDPQGKAARVIGINRDQTREVEAEGQRRRLLMELKHTEKMESIGSLAGGVAHDMNNVLAAIMGMASVLEEDCQNPETLMKALETITRACTRGRDVVKSLLYFARKDLEVMGPVNLNTIAREVVHLLSYTTLKRLQLDTDFQEPLDLVLGDAGALSHALINLCVNAVDAMPEGGTLAIRTRTRAGWGVEISIRDSGCGMSPEVLRKAVEPFFTTKPVGKGTGLGLAMVYGTMQAHNGTFEIKSEEGRGTEIILGFPRLPLPPAEANAEAGKPCGSAV